MIKQSLITITTLGLMAVSASAVDTKGCVACHGADFEKKAMNVSKIVKDMSKDEIVTALKGYKEDKGGAMKGVMKGQVAKFSDADIEAIATQIAGGDKKEEAKADATKSDANATKAEEKKIVAVDTKSCASCHGTDFEKKAMNVSKIVKDMSKADIESALKGYKDGKGGAMKGVMKPMADKLSDEQIKAIAEKFGK